MDSQILEFFREGHRRPAPGWSIGLCRLAFGLMWLYRASGKIPPSFGQGTHTGLWYWIQQEIQYPTFAWYCDLLTGVVLPHFTLFGWLVFVLELLVGLFLMIGLFTRIFATIGFFWSLNLLIGLAAHPSGAVKVWVLIAAFHLLFITTDAGLNWGLDQIMLEKLANSPLRRTMWGQKLMKLL